jgi:hypothetical protein
MGLNYERFLIFHVVNQSKFIDKMQLLKMLTMFIKTSMGMTYLQNLYYLHLILR